MFVPLLLAAALAGHSSMDSPPPAFGQSKVTKKSDNVYESSPFGETTENVKDPKDPKKLLSAEVKYFIRFRLTSDVWPDSIKHYRTVRVRPEKPAPKFKMTSIRVSVRNNKPSRRDVANLHIDSRKVGAPLGIGKVIFDGIKKAASQEKKNFKPVTITVDPNVKLKPNGWTVRKYGYGVFYSYVSIELIKSTRIAGKKKATEEKVFEGSYDLYRFWDPKPKYNEKFYPDAARKKKYGYMLPDGVGGLEFADANSATLGLGSVAFPTIGENVSFVGSRTETTSASDYRQDVIESLPESGTNFLELANLMPKVVDNMLNATAGQGTDMNSLQIPGDPLAVQEMRCDNRMSVPAGTVWLPDRSGYQSLMSVRPFTVDFGAIFVSDSGGIGTSVVEGRMHCLNMNLKEPAAGVRYFPYASNDPILPELAEITAASRFTGPWDLARTWIYTEKIGLDEVNKRIAPPVSASRYVNGLFDVFRLGGLNDRDMESKKIFDPDLLDGAAASDDAFDWFALRMCEQFGRDVRRWIESRPHEIVAQLTSPRDNFDKVHPARLMVALLNSSDKDARFGALNFLDKNESGVPGLKDQIGDLRWSIYSEDRKEAEVALRVVKRYLTELPADVQVLIDSENK